MPILKQLVSGSSHTKRRSRMDLTREMISAPLGDFRHTMHVGRSGDAFGDTSFLSSRSGEPPRDASASPRSPRPGLLSRTFRSSKRSQSVTRVDQQGGLAAPGGSPTYVKNAMSLPFLNDSERVDGDVTRSLSSSPLKQPAEPDGTASMGGAGASHLLELDERSFGELTALPESGLHYGGGGLKHAESVMSFHIDLGPSMLGDILDVMQKEDDDLGYEEGKNSEGRASPPTREVGGDEEDEEEDDQEEEGQEAGEEIEEAELRDASTPPPDCSAVRLEGQGSVGATPPFTPETRPRHLQQLDSSSLSSAGSNALEEKPSSQSYACDTDSATFSAPPEEESNFSSFMEDEDDEIRV